MAPSGQSTTIAHPSPTSEEQLAFIRGTTFCVPHPDRGQKAQQKQRCSSSKPVNTVQVGSDVQAMTEHLRRGLIAKTPAVMLEGEVEIDEVYVVAGHKGQPTAVAKRGGSDVVAGWQVHRAGARGRRTSRPSSA